MKKRLISAAVLVPVALAFLLFLPPFAMTVLISFICNVAAYEMINAAGKLCAKKPSQRAALYSGISAVLTVFFVFADSMIRASGSFNESSIGLLPIGLMIVAFILVCLLIVDYFLTVKSEKRIRPQQLLMMPAAAFLVPLMLASLISLRVQGVSPDPGADGGGTDPGRLLVMIPVVITAFTDSGAFFAGKAFGRRRPLPNISPNKTVEGFIGGILAGTAMVLVYGLIINAAAAFEVSFPLLFVYGVTGAVFTELGDLAFSLIKRKCGIKDFGNIIPGHGGMLDRFDSLIFVSPLILLLANLAPAII